MACMRAPNNSAQSSERSEVSVRGQTELAPISLKSSIVTNMRNISSLQFLNQNFAQVPQNKKKKVRYLLNSSSQPCHAALQFSHMVQIATANLCICHENKHDSWKQPNSSSRLKRQDEYEYRWLSHKYLDISGWKRKSNVEPKLYCNYSNRNKYDISVKALITSNKEFPGFTVKPYQSKNHTRQGLM